MKEYWSHIRSHPGHENDAPPRKIFGNLEKKEIPIILVQLITLTKKIILDFIEFMRRRGRSIL
jgi:hypothetical protein